jgi:hypothetical protein
MTFIGPTGLTLCFTAALFNFCRSFGIAFLPMYAWVGGWTSLMLLILSAGNACNLIRHCTRFTDEVSALVLTRTPRVSDEEKGVESLKLHGG